MKWSIVALVALGVVAAACVAILVGALQSRRAGAGGAGREGPVPIVVASGPLTAMSVVKAENVAIETVRRPQLPEHYLTHAAQVVGKVLSVPMVAGQPFTKACFATEGSGLYLASALPEGKRAVALSLSDYAALEGLLYPGSVVDILVSLRPTGRDGEPVTTTLLRGVQVLAVESRTVFTSDEGAEQGGRGRATSSSRRQIVTVMVDCEQAQVLQLAMQNGTVSLAMRNPMDTSTVAAEPTMLTDLSRRSYAAQASPETMLALLTGQMPAEAAQAGPSTHKAPLGRWEVVIIRGSRAEKQSFPVPAARSEQTEPEG